MAEQLLIAPKHLNNDDRKEYFDQDLHCLPFRQQLLDDSQGSPMNVQLCLDKYELLCLGNQHYENKPIYSNILKILPPKKSKISDKNSDIFHISAQNIDWRHSLEPPCRCGSNKYPQSMFWVENKKSNVYPCKPQFYYINVGFMGVKII